MMAARIELLLIDKDMNTYELNIPTFMLGQLNYDYREVKHHATKKELNTEVTNFLNKHT